VDRKQLCFLFIHSASLLVGVALAATGRDCRLPLEMLSSEADRLRWVIVTAGCGVWDSATEPILPAVVGRTRTSLARGICPQLFIINCYIITDTVPRGVGCTVSAVHASIAHLVHEIGRFNRSQNCAFESFSIVLARDAQENKESGDL
jgi:hypothetical protein